MGKPNSKEEVVADHSTHIEGNAVDASSGIHIFSFHLPTAGFSAGAVLFVLLVIYLCYEVKKRCKCVRRDKSRRSRQPLPPAMYAPMPQGPQVIYKIRQPRVQQNSDRFEELPAETMPVSARVPATEEPPAPLVESRRLEEVVRGSASQLVDGGTTRRNNDQRSDAEDVYVWHSLA